jgi:small subunit ribosomal protein S13
LADKTDENEKDKQRQEETQEKKKVETKENISEEPEAKGKKEPKDKVKETSKKNEDKKEKKKSEKKDKDEDFQYIVRLSNTDVDGEKNLIYGLTTIKGIGINIATLIADETGINRDTKIGKLSEKQIEKIQNKIDSIQNLAPEWMLNHRKDIETGEDIHLTGSDIDMRLREEINTMKKIRSYKGIRHERGLVVRGQRTKGNNRKGLTLGVSKKAVQNK